MRTALILALIYNSVGTFISFVLSSFLSYSRTYSTIFVGGVNRTYFGTGTGTGEYGVGVFVTQRTAESNLLV